MDASIVANIDMTIVQFQRNVPILYGVVLQLFREISVLCTAEEPIKVPFLTK